MGGYSKDPRTRLGLIALLAARRARAEQARRAPAAQPEPSGDAEAPVEAKARPRKKGWFR